MVWGTSYPILYHPFGTIILIDNCHPECSTFHFLLNLGRMYRRMKNTEVALRTSPFDTTPGKKEQAKITGATQGDKIGRGKIVKKKQTEQPDRDEKENKNCTD